MGAVHKYVPTHQDHISVAADLGSTSPIITSPVLVSFRIKMQYPTSMIMLFLLQFIENLTVKLFVNYTHPDDFNGGPNEYRAASGPVIVTCTATGAGSGTISYQWSSTCRNCPFQSATSSSIRRAAVHSGDNGTHTCAVSRNGGTARVSIEFLVVGQ